MYKEIPLNTISFSLEVEGCSCEPPCEYYSLYIHATTSIKNGVEHGVRLWESDKFTFNYGYTTTDDIQNIKEDLLSACNHYNITANLSSDSFWDWEIH